ncbi:organic cation transporter protein-like [Cydia amplana]|uniref:organic cation transporter protein-like n=1 Tax=Cydia amplana TaxID=1869771 RepID=UPI002FE6BCDD
MASTGAEGVCGWGRWQVRLALLLALPVLLTGMYCTNYVFLAAASNHRCLVPECEGNLNETSYSAARADWGAYALPKDACTRYQPLDDTCASESFKETLTECEEMVYESHRSIVAEFGLGCQEWKRSLVGTIHNVGMLISLPIIGHISDHYGRRTALIVSGVGAGILGLCKSLAGSYYAYLMWELLETILGASVYPAAFVLMIEWLGVEHRILASLVLGIPLAGGAATLSLLDYLAGYWRTWCRIAYPPSLLLLLYPWLLPESIRWLAIQNRVSEAVAVMKQAARWNRVQASDEAFEKMLCDQNEKTPVAKVEEESLFAAFIKYGALRRRLSVCFVWWISAVFVFYGLAVHVHALGGSAHATYAMVAAAELPALLLNTLLLDRAGRRPVLTAAFLTTACALVALSCLPDGSGWWAVALYLIGKLGATMSLNALYVYTAELFPTRARHRLLAACSTCGRLGAVLAPLTPMLAQFKPWLPTAIFGTLPLLSAALTRLVPDTLHARLPDSFSDLDPARIHAADV